ncbi:hypothetical protein KR067_003033, partial [Drosophila pandora]
MALLATTQSPNLSQSNVEVAEYVEKSIYDLSERTNRRLIANPTDRFFVNDKKCQVPFADPFSSDVMEIFQKVDLKKCNNESDIISLRYNQKLKRYKVHVDTDAMVKIAPNITKFSCHYREFVNKNRDPYITFQQDTLLKPNISGIVVECHEARNTRNIVQQDAVPLVQVFNKSTRIQTHPLERPPSVIILGLENLSRMNFQRTMPKTANFVRKPNWLEMQGYNKVGPSMLANLCAVFAGTKRKEECIMRFPLMWKEYQRAGYSTAVGEDSIKSSFPLEIPADFELHSLLSALSKFMNLVYRFGIEYCMGRRLIFDYLFDFCHQFTKRLISELDQPVLGLFWSSSFTREYHFASTSLDDRFVKQLELMEKNQVFEHSIVILFSDQGYQTGDLALLPDGFLEQRLPLLHIHLPVWFQVAYEEFATNIKMNRERLTSPYDLHLTLRHILQLNATTHEELVLQPSDKGLCESCRSLFHQLPKDRGCEEACIESHFCTCRSFVPLPHDARAYNVAKILLYHTNAYMLINGLNQFCQRLALLNVDYFERKLGPETSDGVNTYRIGIKTIPETGIYEATLLINSQLSRIGRIKWEDVSVLHNFKNHSGCIDNKIGKKFCFCYPKNLNEEMIKWKDMRAKKMEKN